MPNLMDKLLLFFKPKGPSVLDPGLNLEIILENKQCLGLEKEIYKKFLKDINTAIAKFNLNESADANNKALAEMEEAIHYVDINSTPARLAYAEKFHKLKASLFNDIKKAKHANGVFSMSTVDDAPFVARILADMSPEKADELMVILHEGNAAEDATEQVGLDFQLKKRLRDLYVGETGIEVESWRHFLDNYSIEFLGGGNSKNYKVTENLTSKVYVLKVDNRFSMPSNLDQYVREKLPNVVTPIYAQRQVRGLNPSKKIVSRTLLVTDLCTLGSVEDHSSKQVEPTKKFLGASDIMIQMINVYLEMQNIGIIFPDSKLTNWLVDSDGKIKIADTKSFLKTPDTPPKNDRRRVVSSKGFMPSGIFAWSSAPEKLHASLLGRNIYAYLTGLWPSDQALESSGKWPSSVDSSKDLLDEPIFKTAIGKEYKELIQRLIKEEPTDRISLSQALAKLQELGVKANLLLKTGKYIKNPGISQALSDIVSKVDASDLTQPELLNLLDEIEKISDRCDAIIDKRPSVKTVLDAIKIEIMQSAKSLKDFEGKLLVFEKMLKESLEKYEKYEELRRAIKELKICDNDSEMDKYLKICDQNIFSDGKINVDCISDMEKVRDGLKLKENAWVKDKITEYKDNKWYAFNAGEKARRIEDAMKSIPIEERAKLLKSDDKGVTSLLSALAWHRLNPFSKPIKGKQIDGSNSANTFKLFKKIFAIEINERKDVIQDDSESKTHGRR